MGQAFAASSDDRGSLSSTTGLDLASTFIARRPLPPGRSTYPDTSGDEFNPRRFERCPDCFQARRVGFDCRASLEIGNRFFCYSAKTYEIIL
jgi:hypothetical protein